MGEISNKTIVALLVVALVVTVVGTVVSVSKLSALGGTYTILSGAATGTGTTTLTTSGVTDISVTDSAIAFGTGMVNDSCADGDAWIASDNDGHNCWLNSTNQSHTMANIDDWHELENNGTTITSIDVDLDSTDSEHFLCEAVGGCADSTSAKVMVKAEDGGDTEANSCNGENSTYQTLSTHNAKSQVDFSIQT